MFRARGLLAPALGSGSGGAVRLSSIGAFSGVSQEAVSIL